MSGELDKAAEESFRKGHQHPKVDVLSTSKTNGKHVAEADKLHKLQTANLAKNPSGNSIWGD